MLATEKGHINLDDLDGIPPEHIPAVLAQLAARLLMAGNDAHQASASGGKLLGIKEASSRMGVSVNWLYRNSATLPFVVRVGRSLKFSELGLEKWIRSRSARRQPRE